MGRGHRQLPSSAAAAPRRAIVGAGEFWFGSGARRQGRLERGADGVHVVCGSLSQRRQRAIAELLLKDKRYAEAAQAFADALAANELRAVSGASFPAAANRETKNSASRARAGRRG